LELKLVIQQQVVKKADSCLTGYAMASSSYNGYCIACPDGASSCTLPSTITCDNGYFLRAGICVQCSG